MSLKNVVFLGQVNGRAYYYDFSAGRVLAYVPEYLKKSGAGDSASILTALRAPLVSFVSIAAYSVVRRMNLHTVGSAVPMAFFVILACAAGAAAALLIADNNRRRSENLLKSTVAASGGEAEAVYRKLAKDTRTVMIALPILVLFLLFAPSNLAKSGTIIGFAAYFAGWFIFWMIIFVFRIDRRRKVLREMKRPQ